MQNVGQTWNRNELEQIGRDYVRSYLTRAASMVGRIWFSTWHFYKWTITKGHAPSNFNRVTGILSELGKSKLQIVMNMMEHYIPVPQFL